MRGDRDAFMTDFQPVEIRDGQDVRLSRTGLAAEGERSNGQRTRSTDRTADSQWKSHGSLRFVPGLSIAMISPQKKVPVIAGTAICTASPKTPKQWHGELFYPRF